jgi:SAM-dependent methyltransferase
MTDYSGTDNLEAMVEAVNYNNFLIARLEAFAPKSGKVLDFGAGIGTFAKKMRDRGHDVGCLEPDAGLAARLRSAGLEVSESMDEVGAASIAYVFTLDVLEHIEDDAKALREIAGKLKPGGRLLVYVPAFPMLYSSMDKKVGHFRRYRRRALERLVAEAGFSSVQARYVDSVGFFASLAYRLTDRGSGDINVRALRFYDRVLFPLNRLLDPACGLLFGKNVLLTATRA